MLCPAAVTRNRESKKPMGWKESGINEKKINQKENYT
jgi:hypothetical protein